ncbi:MAG: S8 family peptidase [Burkholderiaceae bacterium]
MADDKNNKRAAAKKSRRRSSTNLPTDIPPPGIGDRLARTTAPRELDDDDYRKKWRLPALDQPDEPGPYVIELNVQHHGGLPGAANAFIALHQQHVVPPAKEARAEAGRKKTEPKAEQADSREPRNPIRIAKTYYLCLLSDNEWRRLVAADEALPMRDRGIYRLWPDFPVTAHTDHSASTIKADAALRSFDAAGEAITWAVIDSGVQADHLHFGSADEGERERHLLQCTEVADLHRCFIDPVEVRDEIELPINPPLADPDADPAMDPVERDKLLEQHRRYALIDDFGHGTHVAGIIAGQAPAHDNGKLTVCALEREYKAALEGEDAVRTFRERSFEGSAARPRGMSPRCRLVSLRVLDAKGQGRASRVIQALEYIRDRINDNPKLMRVHGVNLSVGYEFDAEMFACGQSPLCTAVDRLVQEGVVVVTAAGNTGYGSASTATRVAKMCFSNSINDPGNAASAITVGSTHRDSPHTYGVSYFSSKGPTGDGRMKPDLVAPGERITSCAAGAKLLAARHAAAGTNGGGSSDTTVYYVDDSGTSMAAPHVSGAIAAFLSIRREFIGKPQEVKRIFLESATPLGRERYFEGHGMVDLMRAIQSV